MPVEIIRDNKNLEAFITGEIDHHSTVDIKERIDAEIDRDPPKTLIMDFKDVGFMDSSGIGLVIGRYRSLSGRGDILIRGANENIRKVMQIAGLSKIVKFQKKGEK